ncbi:MAG: hypothetical protein STSR0009_15390 [Methanoregula sp.]
MGGNVIDFLNSSKKSQTIQNQNFNIFASYSTKDREKIKPVLNYLFQIQGVKIFFADADLQPGDVISNRIIQNIVAADIFLAFYSTASIQSSYVQQEIGAARSHSKIIIPLLLDGTKPTGMLAGVHYLDLSDEQKRLPEIGRLHNFIVNNIQTKNQQQLWGALALLGIGALALLASQNSEEDDEYY